MVFWVYLVHVFAIWNYYVFFIFAKIDRRFSFIKELRNVFSRNEYSKEFHAFVIEQNQKGSHQGGKVNEDRNLCSRI
jgi:hypothetical protein